MLGAFIDFKLGHQDPAEPVLGHHAFDGVGDELFRLLGPDLGDGAIFFAAFPAGIGHEFFVEFFGAGEANLFGVDHDDEITRIQVGGENRFVLAAQDVRHLDSETAQDRAVGINNVPLALI